MREHVQELTARHPANINSIQSTTEDFPPTQLNLKSCTAGVTIAVILPEVKVLQRMTFLKLPLSFYRNSIRNSKQVLYKEFCNLCAQSQFRYFAAHTMIQLSTALLHFHPNHSIIIGVQLCQPSPEMDPSFKAQVSSTHTQSLSILCTPLKHSPISSNLDASGDLNWLIALQLKCQREVGNISTRSTELDWSRAPAYVHQMTDSAHT